MGALDLRNQPLGKKWLEPDSKSHNAGTITLIFGLQSYSVVLPALAPNIRHQLFLTPNGLEFSIFENSQGPGTASSWILVGAFQSDDSGAFGAFYNIDGRPDMQFGNDDIGNQFGLSYSSLIRDANGTNVQSGSPVTNTRFYKIEGRRVLFSGGYYHTTTVGTLGVGPYRIGFPQNISVANNLVAGSNTGLSGAGKGYVGGDLGGGEHCVGSPSRSHSNGFNLRLSHASDSGEWGGNGENTYPMNGNFVGVTWTNCDYILIGGLDTPLKDR